MATLIMHDNPYTVPTAATTTYYKTVIKNASFGEIRDITGGTFSAAVVYIFSVLGFAPKPTFGVALKHLTEIAPDDVPASIRHQLRDTFTDLKKSQFTPLCAFQIAAIGPAHGCNVVFSHSDSKCWAAVPFVQVTIRGITTTETGLSLMSQTNDNRFVSTTNLKRRFRGPSNMLTTHLTGHSNTAVIDAHLEVLRHIPVITVDHDKLPSLVRRIAMGVTDYNIERGVHVPMTAEEIAHVSHAEHRTIDRDRGQPCD